MEIEDNHKTIFNLLHQTIDKHLMKNENDLRERVWNNEHIYGKLFKCHHKGQIQRKIFECSIL